MSSAMALAARAEAHAPDQKILRRRQRGECREAQPARELERRVIAGKNSGEAMGKPDSPGPVEAPPRRIPGEELRRADDGAGCAPQLFRKLPRVAQTEVQALARDRMQGLRGVADTHRP